MHQIKRQNITYDPLEILSNKDTDTTNHHSTILRKTYNRTYVGTIKEDYCTICFYLYSNEVTSLGSFV